MSHRIRIMEAEVAYYAKAKHENAIVRRDGQNWRVRGVTADMMGGSVYSGLANPAPDKYKAQWWLELEEA